MAWLAELQTEEQSAPQRNAPRRQLRLDVPAHAGPAAAQVLIHNLSRTGLLIESVADMPLSEEIEVELPELGMTRACVVWRSGGFYGCQFDTPIPVSVLSAAQLRSPPEAPPIMPAAIIERLPASFQGETFAHDAARPLMTLRRKTAIIVGLSAGLWAVIFLLVSLIS